MKMLMNESAGLFEKQKNWYQYFHQNPELSMKEFQTTQTIKDILMELGIQLSSFKSETGVVAIIKGKSEGPEVVLRTDIDALPIQEMEGCTFKSSVKGVSHMCGHDFHISALLGAAVLLLENRDHWQGTVKLLFQPGEETTEGAKYMLKHNVLTGEEVAIFGLHNAPFLPAGTIGVRKGPLFASADTLHIKIFGQKGHAAMPHLTVDATLAASAVMLGLQSIISRNTNPLESAVLTIGSLHSGHGHNIVSDFAEMWGTMRTFSIETRQMMYQAIERTVKGIAESYGAKAKLEILPQTPPVYNDFDLTDRFIRTAAKILSKEQICEPDLIMAAEDFALFQQKVPGCFFLLGTRDPEKGIVENWHDPHFKANEDMLPLASKLLAQAAMDILSI
jgi:amidohydrolase